MNKDWVSQAPLQSPALADVNASLSSHHPALPSPAPLDRHRGTYVHPSFTHSPVQHQQPLQSPVNQHYIQGKDEPSRLPGMMALSSQPGTPRPAMNSSPHAQPRKIPHSFSTSSFRASPYTGGHVMPRKRGRTEPLFPGEIGPLFTKTKSFNNLCTLDQKLLDIDIEAKMDRGFFLADNDWTCYRRNYFQISTAFTISGMDHYDQHPQCHVELDGILRPVIHFYINISSRVSNGDKKIDLVQHTPKRDKGPQVVPKLKIISPGGNLRMTTMGSNATIVTFERIQFKTATANNGKRRAAQQYYVCLVELYACIEGDQHVKIATCQSDPLVVRGRSPGHYCDHQGRYEASMSGLSPSEMTSIPSSQHHHESDYSRTSLPPTSGNVLSTGGGPGGDYGSPYQYHPSAASGYNYPSHNQFGMMSNVNHGPSTPTGQPSSMPASYQQHHQHQHQHQQQPMPYMVSSMSDPSSSESSSPDIYAGDYVAQAAAAAAANNVSMHNNSKLGGHHQLPHPGLHLPMDNWAQSRSRFRQTSQASSDGSSAIYEQQYAAYVPPSHAQGTNSTSYTPTPFTRQYEGAVSQPS